MGTSANGRIKIAPQPVAAAFCWREALGEVIRSSFRAEEIDRLQTIK
jgi:hypothetical protein